MFSKLIQSLFVLFQNEEIIKMQTAELLQAKKVDNLAQLVTLLTIAFIVILSLLILALVQNYKLNKKIVLLKKQVKK